MEAYNILLEILETKSIDEVIKILFIHKGTMKRWLLNKKVPLNYFNDLNALINNKYLSKNDFRTKDQFFTTKSISEYCYRKLLNVLEHLNVDHSKYVYIEPSAGCCNFFEILPKERRIGIDIDPKGSLKKELIKSNYLDFKPDNKDKFIVIGNPPFGLRGNLALRFINHSYEFADIIAFILPPLFNSTGKGVPMTRVKGYKLAHTENLPLNSFEYPNGEQVSVATIFQVWTKVNTNLIEVKEQKTCKKYIKVYSLSDGGTPSSTRNKTMLDKCDVYLPSTCFSGMTVYNSFEKLPNKRGYGIVFLRNNKKLHDLFFNKINWREEAFLSTNSAINLRKDLIENALIKRGTHD